MAAERFRQGSGAAQTIEQLVEKIRVDQPVSVEGGASLAWDEKRARTWAGECLDHVLVANGASEKYERLLFFAAAVAKQVGAGTSSNEMLEDVAKELDVEDWPGDTDKSIRHAIAAAKNAVRSHGRNVDWAADTARECIEAAAAFAVEDEKDPAAARATERAWQAQTLRALLG